MKRTTNDQQRCPKWCEYSEARRHPTNHIAHVTDVVSSVYSPIRVVAVTVEAGLAEDSPLPVLAMLRDDSGAACTFRMAWTDAEQVGRALLEAVRRYA